jgi:hypothetical protein
MNLIEAFKQIGRDIKALVTKTDKNEKNTDRKSVSIFLSNIISISKKNSYSVKFLSFLKTKNFE